MDEKTRSKFEKSARNDFLVRMIISLIMILYAQKDLSKNYSDLFISIITWVILILLIAAINVWVFVLDMKQGPTLQVNKSTPQSF